MSHFQRGLLWGSKPNPTREEIDSFIERMGMDATRTILVGGHRKPSDPFGWIEKRHPNFWITSAAGNGELGYVRILLNNVVEPVSL